MAGKIGFFPDSRLLSGYRALDLTDEKGLICGKLLGDMGVDVIKVEKPGGDAARNIGPFYHDDPSLGKSLYWFAYNTNKRGITLSIESPEGKRILKDLLKTSDFFIESFDPGYLEKLGLSYDEMKKMNPGLIMVSITPFGQTGPYAYYRASDLIIHGMGLLMSECGDPDRAPVQVSFPQSYVTAGTDAAMGALIALYARAETGRGQHVDASAMDSIVQSGLEAIPDWVLAGREWKRPGQTQVMMKGLISPIIWECKDGYISYMFIGGLTGAKANQRLIEWMASEGMAPESLVKTDWEKFDMAGQEQSDLDAIHSAFGKFFKTHTKSEIQEEAIQRKIMMYPICNAEETLRNPQLAARDFWVKIRHEELGDTITYPGAFAKFSETAINQWRGAPRIGEHNEEIFVQELGYSREDLAAMKRKGAI